MWRKAAVVVSALGIAAIAALSAASGGDRVPAAHAAVRTHKRVTVRPTSGGPRTRFVVSFISADRTGRVGALNRRYEVGATGAAGRSCASAASISVPSTRKGQRVRVTLIARSPAHAWCVGTFRGRVVELSSSVCPPRELCPAFAVLVRTVGRFTFRVTRPHADSTPPTFAGLERAVACTPGPQRPGETTPFTLSWATAHDNVTATGQIVYDVYVSSSSGAENFAHPNWTTSPGATTFKTPGLTSHGAFCFVVRARDKAGNEDRNRVERRGVDLCY